MEYIDRILPLVGVVVGFMLSHFLEIRRTDALEQRQRLQTRRERRLQSLIELQDAFDQWRRDLDGIQLDREIRQADEQGANDGYRLSEVKTMTNGLLRVHTLLTRVDDPMLYVRFMDAVSVMSQMTRTDNQESLRDATSRFSDVRDRLGELIRESQ